MSDVHYLPGYSQRPGRPGWRPGVEGISPPPKTVRLADTPLAGYRFWDLEGRPGRFGVWWPWTHPTLVSPATGAEWNGPVMRADQPPGWTLRGSGIYAMNRATAEGCTYLASAMDMLVLGEVQGMGRCVVHERGWRAGVVRIIRLFVHPRAVQPGLLRRLRARYRCEVRVFELTNW